MSESLKARRATNRNILHNNGYARAKSGLGEEDLFSVVTPVTEPAVTISPVLPVSPEPISSDQFLTDRDVAQRYRVQKQTIWRWAKSSTTFPKPFKIEGTTRWSGNELDEHDRKVKEARR